MTTAHGGGERLFASCTFGLEPALEAEARALGFATVQKRGGVELVGPRGGHRLANLWLRTASRITFAPPSGEGAPKGRGRGSNRRPPRTPEPTDTSGELLYLRGYRQEIGRAPLRETLAAGMLLLARWDPAREALWDPMCGSGTLLIEAALIAQGRAPGAQRHFAFESFEGFDPAAWAAEPRQRGPALRPMLLGTDLNSGALGTARRNARRAGALELLTLERADATRLSPRPGPGLVAANLPYGKRVGVRGELAQLYAAFGASLRQAARGWRFAFLLREHADALGLPIAERYGLDNGGLHCTLVVGTIA